jgi:hypothetical protein
LNKTCTKIENTNLKASGDYLFALKQEWAAYLHAQKQIGPVDKEIKTSPLQ